MATARKSASTTPASTESKAEPKATRKPSAEVTAQIQLSIRLLRNAHEQLDVAPAQSKTLIAIVLEGLSELVGSK